MSVQFVFLFDNFCMFIMSSPFVFIAHFKQLFYVSNIRKYTDRLETETIYHVMYFTLIYGIEVDEEELLFSRIFLNQNICCFRF